MSKTVWHKDQTGKKTGLVVLNGEEVKRPDTDPLRCATNAYMRGQMDRFNALIPDSHRATIVHKLDRLGVQKKRVDVQEILKQYMG